MSVLNRDFGCWNLLVLWPDAQGLQPYSLFHYLKAREILGGTVDPFAFVVLAVVAVAAIVWALVVFPRRDLAAPS